MKIKKKKTISFPNFTHYDLLLKRLIWFMKIFLKKIKSAMVTYAAGKKEMSSVRNTRGFDISVIFIINVEIN